MRENSTTLDLKRMRDRNIENDSERGREREKEREKEIERDEKDGG